MLKVIRVLRHACVAVPMLVAMSASAATGQSTAFTYQGQLSDAGELANGSYDVRFALFDGAAGGTQIGANRDVAAVPVSNGVFTVQLDFGVNAFPGANRFVEIGVRPAGGGSFTTLAPRQQISSSPYAIRTLSAATADALSSACVRCVTSAQIRAVAGSKVSGTIPVASLPAGSGNYIQNGTTPQAGGNFNVGGTGTIGGLLSAGSVGIGTAAPGAGVLLEVNGNTRLTPGGSGGSMQLGTPNGETGLSFAGATSRADLRFDDSTLKLVVGANTGPPDPRSGVIINTAGSVGIGIADPTIGRLHVVGAAGIPAIYGESASGFAMSAAGNANQSRDKGGWVKAMALVNADGSIARCYNGQTGSSSGNCDFSVSHTLLQGTYGVNFGFVVNDRFISVTIADGLAIDAGLVDTFNPNFPTTVFVYTRYSREEGAADAPFFIFVF